MDNQHKLIKGYRDLTAEEIALMNQVKEKAELIKNLVVFVEAYLNGQKDRAGDTGSEPHRWLAIAKTDLQRGFMAVTRSVAQPDFF